MSVDFIFYAGCRKALRDMRRGGMNEAMIACCISDIRAAAIAEERMRVTALLAANPPFHPPWGEIMDAIADTKD